jgi:hypothetical protein
VNIERVLWWLDRVGEDVTLVGGQAVALWEHLLGLPIATETIDIDFLGDAAQARDLADALGYRCRIPDAQDPTPKTAILIDDAGVVVADFLAYVAGLNETDILRRRVRIAAGNAHSFYVLHPFDCVASRLANIALMSSKSGPRGYDQLRAAIRVCYAYLIRLPSEGKAEEAIRLANRLFDLALTDTGKRIYFEQGIDLLDALPAADAFGIEAFARENYPRQLERVRSKRA